MFGSVEHAMKSKQCFIQIFTVFHVINKILSTFVCWHSVFTNLELQTFFCSILFDLFFLTFHLYFEKMTPIFNVGTIFRDQHRLMPLLPITNLCSLFGHVFWFSVLFYLLSFTVYIVFPFEIVKYRLLWEKCHIFRQNIIFHCYQIYCLVQALLLHQHGCV